MDHSNELISSQRKLLIKTVKTVKLISYHQIIFIQADNNYSKIFLDDKSEFLLCKTLHHLEVEIDKSIFFRCHRTYLVNIHFIKEIIQGKELTIVLENDHKIPLARRRNYDFMKFLTKSELTTVYSKK
jgi:two-component system LytT family response regulator